MISLALVNWQATLWATPNLNDFGSDPGAESHEHDQALVHYSLRHPFVCAAVPRRVPSRQMMLSGAGGWRLLLCGGTDPNGGT